MKDEPETIKIRVHADLGLVGCRAHTFFVIDREEWDEMDDDERELLCREYLHMLVEWGYEPVVD